MPPLPHFNNSRASVNKDEPLFLATWRTTWVLPTPLQGKYGAEIVDEQIKKINGLNLDKLPTNTVEQVYRFHKRRYAGAIIDTNIDLDMEFEVNVDNNLLLYPYNIFKDWSRLIYDPATGFQGLKRDYTGSLTIDIHNKVGDILRSIYFPLIFPIEPIKNMDLDHLTEEVFVMSIKFAAENPTDLIIGAK